MPSTCGVLVRYHDAHRLLLELARWSIHARTRVSNPSSPPTPARLRLSLLRMCSSEERSRKRAAPAARMRSFSARSALPSTPDASADDSCIIMMMRSHGFSTCEDTVAPLVSDLATSLNALATL